MIQIPTTIRPLVIRHEYWEEEKYNLPISDKNRKPYYVCYEYRTAMKEGERE